MAKNDIIKTTDKTNRGSFSTIPSHHLKPGTRTPAFLSRVLINDVPYGKIIQSPFSTQPLEMLPGFPVPVPGIVFLTAPPISPDVFDSKPLKIVHENQAVISHECFQRAGFIEIEVCLAFCSVFGWWQWHYYCFVRVGYWGGIDQSSFCFDTLAIGRL